MWIKEKKEETVFRKLLEGENTIFIKLEKKTFLNFNTDISIIEISTTKNMFPFNNCGCFISRSR